MHSKFSGTCIDCGTTIWARSTRCQSCANRAKGGGPEARFWSKVDRSGGPDACWPWMAGRFDRGYGAYSVDGHTVGAHRVAFFLTHGYWPAPDGLHACDNPPCCNPLHIFEGTHADNNADRARKGRSARLCGDRHWSRAHPERITRGEGIGNSKLSQADVQAIRLARALGVPLRDLACTYGVQKSTISRIANRRRWCSD